MKTIRKIVAVSYAQEQKLKIYLCWAALSLALLLRLLVLEIYQWCCASLSDLARKQKTQT
jgi:hypothetical protein